MADASEECGSLGSSFWEKRTMNGAKIEQNSLPKFEQGQSQFGSPALQSGPFYDETIIDIMVYLYDALPPDAFRESSV